jgi:acetyltransferase
MIALPTDSLRSLRPAAAETCDWQGRTVVLRALRADDALLLRVLATHVAPADLGLAGPVAEETAALAASVRSVCADDSGPPAFIALDIDEDGRCEALGLVRSMLDDDGDEAMLAIALRHDVKGRRLGQRLVAKTLAVLQAGGARRVSVRVLAANESLRALLRELGFTMDLRRVTPGRLVYVREAASHGVGAPA